MAAVDTAIAFAKAQLGEPYVFGAAGPNNWDCSGLTQQAMKQIGVSLPRRSQDQAKLGAAVDRGSIQAGDLVFSDWGDGPNSHVGIATGPHTIINAPHSGAVVRYQELGASYLTHVTAVRRFGVPGTADLQGAADAAGRALGGAISNDPLTAIGNTIRDAFAPLASVGKLAELLSKAFLPTNFVRLVSGVFGGLLIAYAVVLLGKEARNA